MSFCTVKGIFWGVTIKYTFCIFELFAHFERFPVYIGYYYCLNVRLLKYTADRYIYLVFKTYSLISYKEK